VHLKPDKNQPTCPRKKQKKQQLEYMESVWRGKGRRTMEQRICGKDEILAWNRREKE